MPEFAYPDLTYISTQGIHPELIQVGLFLVHSPLLKESLLLSFPALSDMLKFSA